MLRESLLDALLDPPHGIRDKLEPTRLVEALCSLQQPQVARADKIGQGQALPLIPLGHAYYKAQVGTRKQSDRLFVALADTTRQIALLPLAQQVDACNLLEILV